MCRILNHGGSFGVGVWGSHTGNSDFITASIFLILILLASVPGDAQDRTKDAQHVAVLGIPSLNLL